MLPIGITLGDPSGIGPEVALKALSATLQPAIIFGPSDLINLDYIKTIIGDHELIVLSDDAPISPLIDANWVWISTGSYALDDIHNHHSPTNGYHSYYAVELAMEAAKKKCISGLVTAPISKENWQLAGIDHIDHTTLLGTFFDREPTMAFYSSVLNVALVTVHVPLCEVPKLITGPLLKRTIQRCNGWLNDMGIRNPKIAVAGLNPHAGESGFLGTEELEIIAPVIDSMKTEIPFLSGPYPADTLFIRPNRFDCVIAMYHDQGLAPLKAMAFDSAVNVTLGLPIIRTSPDHGTAFDIAHTDRANPSSMLAAIQLANRLVHGS